MTKELPTKSIVRCPTCNVKLNVSIRLQSVRCPKCGCHFATGFQTSPNTVKESPLGKSTKHIAEVGATKASATERTLILTSPSRSNLQAGYSRFVSEYFRRTRGPKILWFLLGIATYLVSSSLKPFIRDDGYWLAGLTAALLAAVFVLFFLVATTIKYWLVDRNAFPKKPKSLFAKGSCAFLSIGISLWGTACVERFFGDKGSLAAAIPPVAKMQGWFESKHMVTQIASESPSNAPLSGNKAMSVKNAIEKQSQMIGEANRDEPPFVETPTSSDFIAAMNRVETQAKKPSNNKAKPPQQNFLRTESGEEVRRVEPGGAFSSLLSGETGAFQGDAVKSLNIPTRSLSVNASNDVQQNVESRSEPPSYELGRSTDIIQAPEPGGAYSEKLRVQQDVILHGGTEKTIEPGGKF